MDSKARVIEVETGYIMVEGGARYCIEWIKKNCHVVKSGRWETRDGCECVAIPKF